MTSWRTDAEAQIRWGLNRIRDRYAGRRGDAGRVDLTAETPRASTVHHKLGKPGGSGLWHHKDMQLPAYIQNVARAILRRRGGLGQSQAIQIAVGQIKNWSEGHNGHGGKVSADVQAAAAKALAEWEALKAKARASTAAKGGGSGKPKNLTASPGARIELANPSTPDTSGMIALFLPADVAEQIAVPGGLDPSELHVTLAYLGDAPDKALQVRALRAVASAARFGQPLAGTIGGLGQFPAGPDGTPFWVPVDVPGLDMLRARIMADVCGDGDQAPGPYTLPNAQQGGDVHGFTPHVTLTYLTGSGGQAPDPVPSTDVTFGEIALVVGGRRVTLPLGEPDGEDPILLTREHPQDAGPPRVELASNQEGRLVKATVTRPPKGVATRALTPVAVEDLAAMRAMTRKIMKAKPGMPAKVAAKLAARAVRKRRTRKAAKPKAAVSPAGGAVTSLTRPASVPVDLAATPGHRYRIVSLASGGPANAGVADPAKLNTAARAGLASKGKALPGGRFPIRSRADLAKAIKAVGRAKPEDRDKVRAFIRKRARELGAEDMIPDSWNQQQSSPSKNLAAQRRGVDLAWDAAKHPRGKAGTSQGGQFVPLSYNAQKDSGTGYHHKGGGPRVKAVQTKLNRLGFTDHNGKRLAVDGMYGPLTTSALRKFQAAHGMHVTGVVDRATMKAVLGAKTKTRTSRKARKARKAATPKKKATGSTRTTASRPATPAVAVGKGAA